ncbi:MAG: hypothetical protein WBF48_02665 [Halarcobacter sp.]
MIAMNNFFKILLIFLSINFIYANNLCDSIKTNDLVKCIENRIFILKEKINKNNIVLNEYTYKKKCQEVFNDIYPGKEAALEQLLCIEEHLIKEIESFNNKVRKKHFYINIQPKRQALYKTPPTKTKMYLIKGDKVEILEEKDDWLYILYRGKKDIKAWIPKSAVQEKEIKKPVSYIKKI